MSGVVITSAVRTPIGNFNGAFGALSAHYLGQIAIQAALERSSVEGAEVSEVILGQILNAGQGPNPARQASIHAGVPKEVPAWSINQLCGSGLRAVALGYQGINAGDDTIVVAGGMESMSQAPHAAYLRAGQKMGSLELVDTMLKDALIDPFHGYHMGNTAENVAEKYQITREQQAEFAAGSQNKAEAAIKGGKFKDEIVPVTIKSRKGDTVVDTDEFPRFGATKDQFAKLRPAFAKDGTVTAGNASGINDGASVVVVMSEAEASKRGLTPLARIVVCARRRRSGDHGHRPDPGVADGAREGRLVDRRSRSDRGQRGVRRPGVRGQQGPRLGHQQGQRQRWRDRARPSGRRLGCTDPHHPALRDAEARRQEGHRNPLRRRRHGCCHVRRARLTLLALWCGSSACGPHAAPLRA